MFYQQVEISHKSDLYLVRCFDKQQLKSWVAREVHCRLKYQMETFSASLALCSVNSPFTGEFPSQRPDTCHSFRSWLVIAWNTEISNDNLTSRLNDLTWLLWYHNQGQILSGLSKTLIVACYSFSIIKHWRPALTAVAMLMKSIPTSWGIHDDVIKWKHFPRYWPFVRVHRWIPRTNASNAELSCFLWSAPDQTVE